MKQELEQYLTKSDITVKAAMKRIDSTRQKIIFIVDDKRVLQGSLSDGDIRRWILAEGSLDFLVENVSNSKPFFVKTGFDIDNLRRVVIEKKFTAVPVCDNNGVIEDILFWDQLVEHSLIQPTYAPINAHIIIMAGGQGTRLEPFTTILPKPLIPIGNKTIIELIIDKFLCHHIDHFYISINHKARIIKSYFEEVSPNFTIEYIVENHPLGTIGALSLLKGHINKPIILTNCDIIINTDYAEFLKFHMDNGFDLSLIASMMNHKVPYGVCEIGKGGILKNFIEKPEYSFLASTGMYILNADLINLIPDNTFYNITDLMSYLKANGGKIGVYPIGEDDWFDTGEWNEYKKTLEKFKV
jgi:dTDP-glucose pyrophosphorylase